MSPPLTVLHSRAVGASFATNQNPWEDPNETRGGVNEYYPI